MKVLVSFLSLIASLATTIAVVVSLKWRHRIQNVQDTIPGSKPVETTGQRALRVGAAIWLVLFGIVMLLITGAFVIPAIIELFI